MILPEKLHFFNSLVRPPMTAAIVSINVLLFLFPLKCNAHEFEDGFVERSVAVVVRDKIARVEYSIGLNPKTRAQLIDFWTSQKSDLTSVFEGEADDGAEPINSADKVDFLKLSGDNVRRRIRVLVNEQLVTPRLISSLASSRHHVDVTVTLEFSLAEIEKGVPVFIELSDFNFFPSTDRWQPQEAKLKTKMHNAKLGSVGNQRKVDLESEMEVEQSTLSQTPLKPSTPMTSFRPAPFSGGFRYAIKATGNAVLGRSNVASILIRAKRHLDADFPEPQLNEAYKIEAEVIMVE